MYLIFPTILLFIEHLDLSDLLKTGGQTTPVQCSPYGANPDKYRVHDNKIEGLKFNNRIYQGVQ